MKRTLAKFLDFEQKQKKMESTLTLTNMESKLQFNRLNGSETEKGSTSTSERQDSYSLILMNSGHKDGRSIKSITTYKFYTVCMCVSKKKNNSFCLYFIAHP